MYHLIIKVCATLEVLFCALNEEQNIWKSAYCILVTPHHQVCKSNIVARRNMACWYLCVHWLQCKTDCNMLIITDVNNNTACTRFIQAYISVQHFVHHKKQAGRLILRLCDLNTVHHLFIDNSHGGKVINKYYNQWLTTATIFHFFICVSYYWTYMLQDEHTLKLTILVLWGAFTCVGWQVTLCDPICQVTPHSSVMELVSSRAICSCNLFNLCLHTTLDPIYYSTCTNHLNRSLTAKLTGWLLTVSQPGIFFLSFNVTHATVYANILPGPTELTKSLPSASVAVHIAITR